MAHDKKIVAQFQRRFSGWKADHLCLYHHTPFQRSNCRYDEKGQLLELHFCGRGLTEFPSEICQLTNLQELYLTNNFIRTLPGEIGNLAHLRELYIDANKVSTLPSELGKFTQLQHLNAQRNELFTLPSELGNLTHLQSFDLRSNDKLRTISASLYTISPGRYEEDIDILQNHLRTQLPAPSAKADGIKPRLEEPTRMHPEEPRPITLFYCYAHEDHELRDRLDRHLGFLKRSGLVTGWYDQEILAGAEWEQEIDVHLSTASIILLLVSADFVHSDYCYGVEMQKALEMHEKEKACVIPILLRPVDWQDAPFAKLQALPTGAKPITSWRNQEEALEDVAKHIRKVVNTLHNRQKS